MTASPELPFFKEQPPAEIDETAHILYGESSAYSESRLDVLRRTGPDIHQMCFNMLTKEHGLPKPSDVVVDLGSGMAKIDIQLSEFQPATRFIAVDRHAATFEPARTSLESQQNSRISFVEHDLNERLSILPENSADLTMSFFLFYHVGNRDKLLDEVHRLTRPGGHILLATRGVEHFQKHWQIIEEATRRFGVINGGSPYANFDDRALLRVVEKGYTTKDSAEDRQERRIYLGDEPTMFSYRQSLWGEVSAILSKNHIPLSDYDGHTIRAELGQLIEAHSEQDTGGRAYIRESVNQLALLLQKPKS